MAQMMLYKQIL